MKNIKYYRSFDQDFSESKQQNYKLPEDYQWISHKPTHRIISALLYPLIIIFVFCYQKFYARVKIVNKKVLKKAKKHGYYLYSTHTQVFGDVVNHFITTFPKHPYLICSPANLGIVAVGKYLPLAGALPIPDNLHQLKTLNDAIRTRIAQKKPIITYPEAHVWPWHTGIRPMSSAAFHFPIAIEAPVFVATTTYQRSRFFKKPKITIYIDGPIKVNKDLPRKERISQLQSEVSNIMQERASKYSTFSYVEYRPKKS
ncbi:MAG: 1-acyl-sn-glycerol-3-phosphate acyltransferase [Candidatus Saccharibacteria bacterium]|nr:1-acyl-sn-glycerol-3-phosphate acyltransferase [Candidatus Saccharibacteria bacterium]